MILQKRKTQEEENKEGLPMAQVVRGEALRMDGGTELKVEGASGLLKRTPGKRDANAWGLRPLGEEKGVERHSLGPHTGRTKSKSPKWEGSPRAKLRL